MGGSNLATESVGRMNEMILSLDIGTGTAKAVLYDLDWNEAARAESQPYKNHLPAPGWVEQDPESLWSGVMEAIQNVVSAAGKKAKIQGVGMSAQSGSLIPAGPGGEPVYRLITWMDGRTKDLVDDWKAEGREEEVRGLCGWSLYPGLPLPTIAWIRRHAPEIFEKAAHFFSVNDFLAFRLTGERVHNPSNGGGMQLVDIQSGKWSNQLCDLAGITPSQLSSIQPSGTKIGTIKPDLCRKFGLPAGTPLFNGGHDQGCTALGLGITDPGKLLLACGTAWVFTGAKNKIAMDEIPETLDVNFHVLPRCWTISQSLGGLGASLEWWVDLAWEGERTARFLALDQALEGTAPNQDVFFIPITGGHEDPSTTRQGGFSGLQFSHTRSDMARAIMESAGYELRWAAQTLIQSGLAVDSLWMVGGASRSPHWPGILANITGIPIILPQPGNWSALGAALLAGFGLGTVDDLRKLEHPGSKAPEMVQPDPAVMKIYDEGFEAYRHAKETSTILSKPGDT